MKQWNVKQFDGEQVCVTEDGSLVAVCAHPTLMDEHAALIASAPAMLEALRDIVCPDIGQASPLDADDLDAGVVIPTAVWTAIRAVIAKATGQEVK